MAGKKKNFAEGEVLTPKEQAMPDKLIPIDGDFAKEKWLLICKISTEARGGEQRVSALMQNSVTREVRTFPVK